MPDPAPCERENRGPRVFGPVVPRITAVLRAAKHPAAQRNAKTRIARFMVAALAVLALAVTRPIPNQGSTSQETRSSGGSTPEESVTIPVGEGGAQLLGSFREGRPGASTLLVLTASPEDRARAALADPPVLRAGFHRVRLDLDRSQGSNIPAGGPERFGWSVRAAKAAIEWAEATRGADRTRIGLLAVRSTAPVAIRTSIEERASVRALALIEPRDAPRGVNLDSDFAAWDHLPTLVLASGDDVTRSVRLVSALAAFEGTRIAGRALDRPTKDDAVASFFGSVLGRDVEIRVPCFESDHPDVRTAGFVRRALRPRRHVGDAVHELMTFGVGDRWTLGAMVRQPFEGTVVFKFSNGRETVRDIVVPFVHPSPSDGAQNDSVQNGEPWNLLEASRGSAGPWGWITLETDLRHLTEPAAPNLAVEFRDAKDRLVVRLPDSTPDAPITFRPVPAFHASPVKTERP